MQRLRRDGERPRAAAAAPADRDADRARAAWRRRPGRPRRDLQAPRALAGRVTAIRATSSVGRPDEDALAAAAAVLNGARAVTILAGAGCEGAHDELVSIAGRLKAPVVHAMRGKEFVEYDNPYDVGMTGLLGFVSGYRAMEHCDALLVLGSDFPYGPFYPEGARDRAGRRPRRADRPAGAGRRTPRRHRQGHGRRAAAASRGRPRRGATWSG